MFKNKIKGLLDDALTAASKDAIMKDQELYDVLNNEFKTNLI